MAKIFKCWPFKLLTPPVQLVEGFEAYDGVLKDPAGTPHKGIDYVRWRDGSFISFEVFSMHEGEAFQGVSKTWGRFVVVRRKLSKNLRYDTIYAHLDHRTPSNIPILPGRPRHHKWPENYTKRPRGRRIKAGTYLGWAGITGKTNRIVQLHLELHKIAIQTGERQKLDPYGLYARASSGKYPQPGSSLRGLRHFWISDSPPFAG